MKEFYLFTFSSIYFMPEGGRTSSPSLDSTDGRVDTPPLAHFGRMDSPAPPPPHNLPPQQHLADSHSCYQRSDVDPYSSMGITTHVTEKDATSQSARVVNRSHPPYATLPNCHPPFSADNLSSSYGHQTNDPNFGDPFLPPPSMFQRPPPPIGNVCHFPSFHLTPPFQGGEAQRVRYPLVTPPYPPHLPPPTHSHANSTFGPTMGVTLSVPPQSSSSFSSCPATTASSSVSRPTNCRFLSNETITKWISTGEAARLEHNKNNFGGGGGSGGGGGGGNIGYNKSTSRKDAIHRASGWNS